MAEGVNQGQTEKQNGTALGGINDLKGKKGANMVIKILAIVLVPLAAIAVMALNSAGDRISDAMMKHELAATEYALEMSLSNSAPGDFSYENGALYKGELNLTDNKQVLDAFKQNAGVDVAMFWGSDLAVTNLTGDAITLSEKVASKVLGGESYFSNSLKLGDTGCYAYLAPLKNTDGTDVGILAACIPVREVNELYKGIVTGRAIAILILVAVFCVSTLIVVGMIGILLESIEYLLIVRKIQFTLIKCSVLVCKVSGSGIVQTHFQCIFRRLTSPIPAPFSPLICSLLTSSVINKATSFVPLTVMHNRIIPHC